uniref:Uncharacterized protein n=1 Tax=Setaria digitata TaxID=48799 RepID=A0A915Q754_9BILA
MVLSIFCLDTHNDNIEKRTCPNAVNLFLPYSTSKSKLLTSKCLMICETFMGGRDIVEVPKVTGKQTINSMEVLKTTLMRNGMSTRKGTDNIQQFRNLMFPKRGPWLTIARLAPRPVKYQKQHNATRISAYYS